MTYVILRVMYGAAGMITLNAFLSGADFVISGIVFLLGIILSGITGYAEGIRSTRKD